MIRKGHSGVRTCVSSRVSERVQKGHSGVRTSHTYVPSRVSQRVQKGHSGVRTFAHLCAQQGKSARTEGHGGVRTFAHICAQQGKSARTEGHGGGGQQGNSVVGGVRGRRRFRVLCPWNVREGARDFGNGNWDFGNENFHCGSFLVTVHHQAQQGKCEKNPRHSAVSGKRKAGCGNSRLPCCALIFFSCTLTLLCF